MKCPKCAVELEVKLAGSVEVDECGQCGGTWFEDDELRKAKDSWDGDLKWMDFDFCKDAESLQVGAKGMACPGCGKELVAVVYADTGVEVDACPSCQGIWLDDGEFGKIIDALTQELLHKPFSSYLKASLEEAKEIITGNESVASEWRDFKTVLRLLQYRLLSENPRLARTITDAQASMGT